MKYRAKEAHLHRTLQVPANRRFAIFVFLRLSYSPYLCFADCQMFGGIAIIPTLSC
jgi:hypothetical protein